MQITQRLTVFALALLPFAVQASDQSARTAAAPPLPNAHAHNDYLHERPLHDALDFGFTSIEADIFLIEGQLLVAHSPLELHPERTLEQLYLKPLQQIAHRRNGRIFPKPQQLTLLIDIKNKGKQTWVVLDQLLSKYDHLISQTIDGERVERAITVIISGDRPMNEIAGSNPRRAGIDGRLSDLDSRHSADLMPLISDHWGNHFKYQGSGEMTEDELKKLKNMTSQFHRSGRRIRFWATPESPDLWKRLRQNHVDLIGTDDLSQLSQFLSQASH